MIDTACDFQGLGDTHEVVFGARQQFRVMHGDTLLYESSIERVWGQTTDELLRDRTNADLPLADWDRASGSDRPNESPDDEE
jgi:hypothetical protein